MFSGFCPDFWQPQHSGHKTVWYSKNCWCNLRSENCVFCVVFCCVLPCHFFTVYETLDVNSYLSFDSLLISWKLKAHVRSVETSRCLYSREMCWAFTGGLWAQIECGFSCLQTGGETAENSRSGLCLATLYTYKDSGFIPHINFRHYGYSDHRDSG